MSTPLLTTTIKSLKLIHQGKGRDIYDIDENTMLLVSTDRLSAFDVILPTGVTLMQFAKFTRSALTLLGFAIVTIL
jgi:phosphoribosylaminoimidazole-succinocarboxamide synthase